MAKILLNSTQGSNRKLYDVLIERVFRDEEKKNDARVGKADIDALEKEISIDIADLRYHCITNNVYGKNACLICVSNTHLGVTFAT